MSDSRQHFWEVFSHFTRGERINANWTELSPRSRDWEQLYRNRWQHDKVVRSTHGVNCTGSCSWKIHVKNGVIAYETQATDYPSLGADVPEYEPRGCPRGASFSWYEYSPLRIKYPYVRKELLMLWRQELAAGHDPITAYHHITQNPDRVKQYREKRGKGGFIRATWDEVTTLLAASSIHTIQHYGPDRIIGFSPIPAMSQVSYTAGARFLSLLGGTLLSFYDWYADLPPASPQIWGDQTDVPESADWYNASYMIIWGTNLPMTRTPDAHFMVEARYNGTKVTAVSPDYAEYVKFADTWLPAKAGTDAALAMAMTHVILKEFYFDEQTPYFEQYVKQYTDLPFLIMLSPGEQGYTATRFLRASDLDHAIEHGEWKTLIYDAMTDHYAVPNGCLGYRYEASQKWNLIERDENDQPFSATLSLKDHHDSLLAVSFPYFAEQSYVRTRHVPAKKVINHTGEAVWVTTVFDLLAAHVGVSHYHPTDEILSYEDNAPFTPAWQEAITGVDRALCIRVAREFATHANMTKGKALIALGAGTNHWYHSDTVYRAIINLVLLCGCQGVNGGGWAHYVGQEKVRPVEGFGTIAFAKDWISTARQQNGTSFFYFVTEQFRYEELSTKTVGSPLGGRFTDRHPADMNLLAARLGWLPSFPQFVENSLDTVKKAKESGAQTAFEIAQSIAKRLVDGDLTFAMQHPNQESTYPRLLFVWRSNLLGSSSKGHEYFLQHLLGTSGHPLAKPDSLWTPQDIVMNPEIPKGKLDLLVTMDFRMTGTALYSDIVLPAATWYEKHDISSTDMHPFIHPFQPAISPPYETKSDWQAFVAIAKRFSELAEIYLPATEDVVMAPLAHDSIDEIAQPLGEVKDWLTGEVEPIPGKTMPKFILVQRDYPHLYEQMITVGPLAKAAIAGKGIKISGEKAYDELIQRVGVHETTDAADLRSGKPRIQEERQVAEAILTLSGATNGRRANEQWKALAAITGLPIEHVEIGKEEVAYTFEDLTVQPRLSLATPIWSGLESETRRYSPFTSNVELKIPWHTLTGRQHFYVDHEVMRDFGEALPTFRPPLGLEPFMPHDEKIMTQGQTVVVRYLTPHQKWGIHSTYTDNLRMLSLFRGGQTIWMANEDAQSIGIADNDWVEVYNRNGAIAARAVVTHRIPKGIAMMYHAQDRTVGVPGSAITKDRAGTHNSVTRIIPKPTHMIGGYAQLSYGFNYYGPTGHQRDVMTVIRPLKEVNWLED